ncbi:CBS domain-containing protein [Roseococcus pinisoli]|uniref:CBS domain-containing protein n=1 Tax=Roseococcus pinisoli TaxID=2835040 RepID=A0ABS5Q9A7_9PROT|nr:CBS domain-containing protein [Roseococcus pinisoli]MBS7810289.1 CBS domain-containing protein [Roseococcus pinisoli]
MREPNARELMSEPVVTIPPDMPVADIARLLAERGISAVPVEGEEGVLLGLVTEADLICRLAARLDHAPSWVGSLFVNADKAAERYARAHGWIAEEVMTQDVVTVGPDAPASAIAAAMEQHGIRRVVVVEAGRIQGVVSRRDLLRALDVSPPEPAIDVPSDDRIRSAVVAIMRREAWAGTAHASVEVHEGVVEFHGLWPGRSVQRGLRVLAEQVHGVKGVSDQTIQGTEDLYWIG